MVKKSLYDCSWCYQTLNYASEFLFTADPSGCPYRYSEWQWSQPRVWAAELWVLRCRMGGGGSRGSYQGKTNQNWEFALQQCINVILFIVGPYIVMYRGPTMNKIFGYTFLVLATKWGFFYQYSSLYPSYGPIKDSGLTKCSIGRETRGLFSLINVI